MTAALRTLFLAAACAAIGWPAFAQDIGDPQLGRERAEVLCGECHETGARDLPSPLPDAPSFARIANVPGMTATALLVVMQTSHETMPNFTLEAEDLRNVVAYILSLQEDQAQQRTQTRPGRNGDGERADMARPPS